MTGAEVKVYLALVGLERALDVGTGGRLFIGQRRIRKVAGVSLGWVGKSLDGLMAKGLIVYKPGAPRKWERKAGEIRRVVPVPTPGAFRK